MSLKPSNGIFQYNGQLRPNCFYFLLRRVVKRTFQKGILGTRWFWRPERLRKRSAGNGCDVKLCTVKRQLGLSSRRCSTRPALGDLSGKEKLAADKEAFQKAHEGIAPWWLRAFARKEGPNLELYKFNPEYFTWQKFRDWRDRQKREAEIGMQCFIEERHQILGNDLATATFIVFRGGKAKFVGQDSWHALDEKTKKSTMPTKFTRGWFLEALDASGTDIRYEGLENFFGLPYLKWMSFADCEHVDDWFIDRISGEFGESLEYLDLSGCTQLTENMLSCMYRCRNLKELVLNGVAPTKAFQYGCLLLEDAMPGLTISGVQYMDVTSLK